MIREMNKTEKESFKLICIWRRYCPKFKPFTKEENIHAALKEMLCEDKKCKIRDTDADTVIRETKKQTQNEREKP
jgi:hypothetical protein